MDAGQIVDHACRLAGMEDDPTREIAWDFLRNRWSLVWNAYLWRTGLKTANFGPDYYREFLTLPSVPDLVAEVSTDDTQYLPESDARPNSPMVTVSGPTVMLFPPLPQRRLLAPCQQPLPPLVPDLLSRMQLVLLSPRSPPAFVCKLSPAHAFGVSDYTYTRHHASCVQLLAFSMGVCSRVWVLHASMRV
jgi:hypothetical protein